MNTWGSMNPDTWEEIRKHLGLDEAVTLDKACALITGTLKVLNAMRYVECPDCGHAIGAHADKNGCEIEKGDQYRSINGMHEIEQAMGPCSCTAEGHPDLQRAIDVIRKATGRAA